MGSYLDGNRTPHMNRNVDIQRICLKAKPGRDHPEYYEWQTASICMFIHEDDKLLAVKKAREELARRHWEFLAYEDKSTLIEARVKAAGGEVWEAFLQARSGQVFFRVFPKHFGAGDKAFRPILPARITEAFMDRVIEDAGGRRIRDEEKRPGIRNADYLIGGFILELKDLQEEGLEKGQHQRALAEVFRGYFPAQQEVTLDPSILSKPDYLKYLDIIGKPIKTHIRSASKQIKATRKLFGRDDLRGGIILLNTGFGSFPHQAFAAQVKRYVTKDSRDFSVIISISVWSQTNGFDTYVFYEFSPKEPQTDEVVAVRQAFGQRFEQMMTDTITGSVSGPVEEAVPRTPVAFEGGGIDFAWVPPRVPLPWEREEAKEK